MSQAATLKTQRERSDWRLSTPDLVGRTPAGSRLRVLNVSREGLCFETAENLMIGIPLDLRLDLPNGVAIVPGLLVWSRPMGSEQLADGGLRPVFRAGLAFRGSEETIESLLDQILGAC